MVMLAVWAVVYGTMFLVAVWIGYELAKKKYGATPPELCRSCQIETRRQEVLEQLSDPEEQL
jgi:hypothetical protein